MLPDDDMRYAIETCRSSFKCFSVNNFRLIYNIQGGSNMTGTDLYVNKLHCAAAVRP